MRKPHFSYAWLPGEYFGNCHVYTWRAVLGIIFCKNNVFTYIYISRVSLHERPFVFFREVIKMKIGIVGATGEVGRMMVKVLDESGIKVDELRLFASRRSVGKEVIFRNISYFVEELTEEVMKEKFDYFLFSAGSEVSKKYAPIAAEYGNSVIDNSSAFRMYENIPLVIPEINSYVLKDYRGIIANPNCSTIQMLLALNGIKNKYTLKKIFVSTYQSVSGAGNKGIKELQNQENGNPEVKNFSKKIKNNIIPIIGNLLETGYTDEEMKMVNETRKIFDDYSIEVFPTTVRVPVYYCHSETVTFEVAGDYELKDIRNCIEDTEDVRYDDGIVTPDDVAGSDITVVSRLREISGFVSLWVVADNIRVGAATNAVRILKKHYEINGDNL